MPIQKTAGRHAEDGRALRCPACNSRKFWRNGFNKNIDRQMYKCKTCKKQFHNGTGRAFPRFRQPAHAITYALRLYRHHGRSPREIAAMLQRKNLRVSHVAVYRWIKKFEPMLDEISAQADAETRLVDQLARTHQPSAEPGMETLLE